MRSKKPSKTWAWDEFNNTIADNIKIPPGQKEWWSDSVSKLMSSRLTIDQIGALTDIVFLATKNPK